MPRGVRARRASYPGPLDLARLSLLMDRMLAASPQLTVRLPAVLGPDTADDDNVAQEKMREPGRREDKSQEVSVADAQLAQGFPCDRQNRRRRVRRHRPTGALGRYGCSLWQGRTERS